MRLIDADKVMEEIHRIGGHNLCEWETLGVKALIDRQPTVDINTEVAREIFAEIEKDGKYAIDFVKNHKSYSEEVRQAKLECYEDIQTYLAELKNKYTKEGVASGKNDIV